LIRTTAQVKKLKRKRKTHIGEGRKAGKGKEKVWTGGRGFLSIQELHLRGILIN
jgi:hypothetical protein